MPVFLFVVVFLVVGVIQQYSNIYIKQSSRNSIRYPLLKISHDLNLI